MWGEFPDCEQVGQHTKLEANIAELEVRTPLVLHYSQISTPLDFISWKLLNCQCQCQ